MRGNGVSPKLSGDYRFLVVWFPQQCRIAVDLLCCKFMKRLTRPRYCVKNRDGLDNGD